MSKKEPSLKGQKGGINLKSKFKIEGLDCANCAAELERAIQKIDDVESCNINFLTEKMEIEHNEINKKEVLEKVKKVIKKEEPDVIIDEV